MCDAARRTPNQPFGSRLVAIWLAAILLLCSTPAFSGARLERVEIVTATGTHAFQVEMARTPMQRAKGLMFRRDLPADRGMLFDFHRDDAIMMWMKNTYVPLDMIFVSREGKVVSIAQDATPMSETVISSERPAYAVLEVAAGTARRIGLAAGDALRHPMFKP